MKHLGGLLMIGLVATGCSAGSVTTESGGVPNGGTITVSAPATTATLPTTTPPTTEAPTTTSPPTTVATTSTSTTAEVATDGLDGQATRKGATDPADALAYSDGEPIQGSGYRLTMPPGWLDARSMIEPELVEAAFEGTDLEDVMSGWDPAILEMTDLAFVNSWDGSAVNVVLFQAPPADADFVADVMAEQMGAMFGVEALGEVVAVNDVDVAVVSYELPTVYGTSWTRQYMMQNGSDAATVTFTSPVGPFDPEIELEVIRSFAWD